MADGDELTPEEQAKFSKFYEQARAQERAEAERKKPPKDAADLVERTAHRVVELLHEEAANRQPDPEPSRGDDNGAGGGFSLSSLGFGNKS